MLLNFFKTDDSYLEEVKTYGRKDALLALVLWGIVMVTYAGMGQFYASKGADLGLVANIVLAGLTISLVIFRKEKSSTIGFTKKNAVKSMLVGTILGMVIVLIHTTVNLTAGHSWAPPQNIAMNLVFYMVVISLAEEVIFRGYIQTRIYGLVPKPIPAILLGGIFFMLMHIPFQMGYSDLRLFTYIQFNWLTLSFTFLWHIVFDFLYRKYNAIHAPTIFHGLMDWANYLFV